MDIWPDSNCETLSYQPPSLVVVQINERPDVTLAPSPLSIHKLFRLFITKLHIVSTAPPLPFDSISRWGRRRWPRWCSVPGGFAATLQEVSHATCLGHSVGHTGRCDGVNKRCLPDIYDTRDKQKRGVIFFIAELPPLVGTSHPNSAAVLKWSDCYDFSNLKTNVKSHTVKIQNKFIKL